MWIGQVALGGVSWAGPGPVLTRVDPLQSSTHPSGWVRIMLQRADERA